MVFFWRGAGIFVLIFFFICAWLTSYSFEDTRFGNAGYIGWTMIWTSIPSVLLVLIVRGWPETEPAPGEVPTRNSHWSHSFMFIPIAIWPVILLAGGLYFVNKNGDDDTYDYSSTSVVEEEVLAGERIINFWNPTGDTVDINTNYTESGEQRMDQTIGPGNIVYATYEADKYTFKYNNHKRYVSVQGSNQEDTMSYTQAWYLLDHKVDLILLEVSAACVDTINETELREIDWTSRVSERFKGGDLIEPQLISKNGRTKYTVIDPTFKLPLNHAKREKVYSLIPINRDDEVTEEYLDSMVVDICF